jgi:O-acetyl-ADP-ribose deacetylase (regulator of RNase III)
MGCSRFYRPIVSSPKGSNVTNRSQPDRHFCRFTNPRYIVNFPTKRHWRDKSRIEDIESGLAALVEEIQKRSIRSIAMPSIGAGLGGLPWIKVRGLIDNAMMQLNETSIIVLEPH